MVTFELFARPILEALAGMTPRKLVFLHAKLKSEIKTKLGSEALLTRNSLRRVRAGRSRIGTLARLRRHRRNRSGELLHRDSAGSRANRAGRMGSTAKTLGSWFPN